MPDDSSTIVFRIERETKEVLQKLAESKGITLTAWVTGCIGRELAREITRQGKLRPRSQRPVKSPVSSRAK